MYIYKVWDNKFDKFVKKKKKDFDIILIWNKNILNVKFIIKWLGVWMDKDKKMLK